MEKLLSVLSLVLGILSFLCCCLNPYASLFVAIIGVILGVISLIRLKKDPLLNMNKGYKDLAVVGIICSSLGLLVGLCCSILYTFAAVNPAAPEIVEETLEVLEYRTYYH